MYEAQITVEVGNNEKHISVVFFHSFSFLLIKNTSSSLQHQHSLSSRAEKIEIMQTSIKFLSAAFSIERKQRKNYEVSQHIFEVFQKVSCVVGEKQNETIER
jgi:hypothetical protein